jgi:hypothetical protein
MGLVKGKKLVPTQPLNPVQDLSQICKFPGMFSHGEKRGMRKARAKGD